MTPRQAEWVPALGVTRRLRALAAIGYGTQELADRRGCAQQLVAKYRAGFYDNLLRVNAEKWCALYDELHMLPGPSQRARNHAAREGWGSPLAWDDIDDPDETPQAAPADDEPDENLLHAFLAERPPAWSRLTEADRVFLLGALRARGYTCSTVARQLNAAHGSVKRYWEAA